MHYRAPSPEALQAFFAQPNLGYKKDNGDRLLLIKTIQALSQIIDNPIGILIFGLEEISRTYQYISPNSQTHKFFNTGSTLIDIFKTGLNITADNPLDNTHKLIYLSSLLSDLKAHSADTTIYNAVKINIERILADSNHTIDLLLHKKPSAHALKHNFALLPQKYHVKKKSGREAFIHLIKMIDKECEEDHLDAAQIPFPTQKQPIGYTVRFATLLYIMSELESEYTFRSELYTLCQQTLNVTHTSEIPAIEKRIYYNELLNFIPQQQNSEQTKSFFSAMEQNLKSRINLLNKSIDYSADSHPYIASLSQTISQATQFGIQIGVANVACNFTQTGISKYLVSSAAGIAVSAIFGAEGRLITQQVESAVENHVMPRAVTNFVGRMLKHVSKTIGNTAGQTVYLTLSIPLDAVNALEKFVWPSIDIAENPHDNPAWMKALLDLPDTIFPEAKKIHVRNVIDPNTIDTEQLATHTLKLN